MATEIMPQQVAPIAPWKDLAPKQKDLMRLCREKTGSIKVIGVFGTRKSGKSIGCEHAIADHLWRTREGKVLIVCRTQGDGTTGGIWNHITEQILPRWMGFPLGKDAKGEKIFMQWAEKGKPRATIAKKMVCEVTNMHGGTSKLMLDSLDDEREVEKYKSRDYTMIYWVEAGEFKDNRSFSTFFLCLRGIGYQPDDFVFLIDANPPDEGEDHFLFENFYRLRVDTEADVEQKAFQKCLHLTEWSMEDNPYMTDDEKNAVKGAYRNDPDLYDRYIRGLWKRATRDAIFADIFKPAVHVLDPGPTGQMLLPSENCVKLYTSHDEGFTNPVTYVIDCFDDPRTFKDKDGKEQVRMVKKFLFLDELAYIGVETRVSKFTREWLEMMDRWENELGTPIRWEHYSDKSALVFGQSISDRTVADEIYSESGGRIKLIGVEKDKGSVEMAIRLWRKLLIEDRILISGLRCPKLIEAHQCLAYKKVMGKVVQGKVQTGSKFKHCWDAARYCLMKLCWDELQSLTRSYRAQSRGVENSGLVSVRL